MSSLINGVGNEWALDLLMVLLEGRKRVDYGTNHLLHVDGLHEYLYRQVVHGSPYMPL